MICFLVDAVTHTVDEFVSPVVVSVCDGSVSTTQLEILPADPTASLRALVSRQKPVVATGAAPGKRNHGGQGSSAKGETAEGAAVGARALAALPKGMRFSSPKAADKSRNANRRRLAASARNVASDRWAAQLGFRDGQEHIRELK